MAPSVVQQVSSKAATSTSIVLTVGTGAAGVTGAPAWGSTTTLGNVLVLCGRVGGGDTVNATITDTGGNTWVIDKQGAAGASQTSVIAHAVITTNLVTGNTITVPVSASISCEMACIEVTGIPGTVDQSATLHQGSATAVTVVTGTNSAQGGDLVISVCGGTGTCSLAITTADASSGGTWTDLGWPTILNTDVGVQVAPAGNKEFSAAWAGGGSNGIDATVVAYNPSSTGTNAAGGLAAGSTAGEQPVSSIAINMTINGM